MENQSLPQDQRDLLRAFIDEKVRFLVVGGYAFSAHAFMRATKDIDLWIEPTLDNAKRVWSALAEYGAPLEQHDIQLNDFQTLGLIYQLGIAPVRIDLMTSIAKLNFIDAWEQRVEIQLAGLCLPVIGLDHLIQAKRVADRPQDRVDLDTLLKVKQQSKHDQP